MNKIFLILQREYISRVKKKSFLLTTFLTPLLIGGLYALAIYLAVADTDERKVVKVIDESGLFTGKLQDDDLVFEYVNQPLDSLQQQVNKGAFDALLYIEPVADSSTNATFKLYTETTPGLELMSNVEHALEKVIKEEKLEALGISQAVLDSLNTEVDVQAVSLSGEKEKSANAAISMAVGSFSGFLIYMFMIVYGAQVMRGVMQEKTSKIVEILVSSVRPFQLMMGKILGVAAVGLTQFVLWLVLSGVLISAATAFLGLGGHLPQVPEATQAATQMAAQQNEIMATIQEVVNNLNIPLLLGMFFFYFLTGYLFYAALFAMIGSAVDSEADTQQFMMPIMLPIIASMMFFSAVIRDPSGPIAFWLSIIPFSSPIIMMVRLPFDVPTWQLILSMALMILGFIGTTWIAGRVYRIGILMHGAKVNYKVLFKWLTMKY